MNISSFNNSLTNTVNLSDQSYKCFTAQELAEYKAANFNWPGLLFVNILLVITLAYGDKINRHIDNELIDIKEIATATLFILNVAILITNYLLI